MRGKIFKSLEIITNDLFKATDVSNKGQLQFQIEKFIIQEKKDQKNDIFLGFRIEDEIQKLKGNSKY